MHIKCQQLHQAIFYDDLLIFQQCIFLGPGICAAMKHPLRRTLVLQCSHELLVAAFACCAIFYMQLNTRALLTHVQNVQVSDTTGDARYSAAGNTKN